MKKKNLSKLNLKKNIVSELNNTHQIIGGAEKSIHETNCNQCPPTGSAACPIIEPEPATGSCHFLCSNSCNITCLFC